AVHLDAGERCAVRVDVAARLAAEHGGHVLGIVASGLPDLVVGMNSNLPDGLECVVMTSAFLRERAQSVASNFESQMRRGAAGAAAVSHEVRVVEGEVLDAVVLHGRCSDIVVVGQGQAAAGPGQTARDFPQQVLVHAGPPVLIVPSAQNVRGARMAGAAGFAAPGGCVLVAWKDTREAMRALRDAMPLLRRAGRIVLLEIVEPQGRSAGSEASLTNARVWLARHGVEVEVRRESEVVADVGEALLGYAAAIEADLLVMGGYGRSRLAEWLLGGVTRLLLERTTLPTLMSH
ncbi:MAG: universal stress protein, partial [Caldimonas sp.]